MKIKKLLGMTLFLIKFFLLSIPTTALATKEIEIKSITCPDTIVLGTKTGSKLNGTITLTFEEYLKGVVYREVYKESGWGKTAPLDVYKAQAIAARTYAIYHMGKHAREALWGSKKELTLWTKGFINV